MALAWEYEGRGPGKCKKPDRSSPVKENGRF